ncbi:MAG: ABC transporter substrate-binding protein [Haloferacaceae archaeon]
MTDDGTARGTSNRLDRRSFLAATGVGVSGLVAGCSGGSSSDGTETTTSDDSGTTQPTTKTPGSGVETFQAAASHYPIVPSGLIFPVSQQQGFYEEQGLELGKVTSFGGGGTTIRGVVTGGIPIAGGSGAGVIKAFTSGAPVHIIANIDEPPPIDVVTPASSDIETIQDLAGKTVGFTNPGSVSQQLLAASIESADGISLDEVTLKAMGGLGETISGLDEGIIDAGWSNITVSIPRIESGDWRRVYGTWEYAKIPNLVLLAGQRTIEEQPEFLQGVVDAHAKAGEFYRNNTGEVAKLWADLWDNIDRPLAEKVLEKKLEISHVGVWPNSFRKSSLENLARAMHLSGILDQGTPPWDQILDQRFLPEADRVQM